MISEKYFFPVCCFILSSLLTIYVEGEDLESDVVLEKAKLNFIYKKYEVSLSYAEEVLKKDSSSAEAYLVAAQSSFLTGRYEKAKEYFERLFLMSPDKKDEYQKDYAIVLAALGETGRAEGIFRESLLRDGEDSLVSYRLGELLYRTGRVEEAERLLVRVFERRDEYFVPAGVILSEIYLNAGKREEAERTIRLLESEKIGEVSSQIVDGLRGRVSALKGYYRRLALEFSMGTGYDTNSIYVVASEEGEGLKKESFFSQLSFDLMYNPVISARKRLYVALGLLKSFNFEESASQFDRLLLNPKIGYKFYTGEDLKIYVDAGYEYTTHFFSGGERVGFNDFGWYVQSNSLYLESARRFSKYSGIIRYTFSFIEYEDHNRSNFDHRLMLVFSTPLMKRGNAYLGVLSGFEDARLNMFDYVSGGGIAGAQIYLLKNLYIISALMGELRRYIDNTEERKDNLLSVTVRPEMLFEKRYFVNLVAQYNLQDSSVKNYSIERTVLSLNLGFYY